MHNLRALIYQIVTLRRVRLQIEEVLGGARLGDALRCATRIRVRSGGLCHRRRADERTLFESAESSAVKELAELVMIDSSTRGFHCMCCGKPTLEFYRGDVLVAELGFHHGQSLRWRGWPGDAALEAEQGARLCAWLKEHGVKDACPDPHSPAPDDAGSPGRAAQN